MTAQRRWWPGGRAGRWVTLGAVVTALTHSAGAQGASATPQAQPPAQDYLVFVASEGNDRISLVRFGPGGTSVERVSKIGRNPTEPVGPHGIGLSPDKRYYYVSTAHGFPNGELWKYTTVGDSLKGTVTLGLFPATLQVSPDGLYAYVVNFTLYGEMVPSSVYRRLDATPLSQSDRTASRCRRTSGTTTSPPRMDSRTASCGSTVRSAIP